jgi:hypothetical protein
MCGMYSNLTLCKAWARAPFGLYDAHMVNYVLNLFILFRM